MERAVSSVKIRTKLILLFSLTALVPLGGVSFLSIRSMEEQLTQAKLESLSTRARNDGERISAFVQRNVGRLALLTNRVQLRFALAQYLKEATPENQKVLSSAFEEAMGSIARSWRGVILATSGEVLAASDPRLVGKPFPYPEVLAEGRERNNVAIFVRDRDGVVHYYLAGPFILEGEAIGVVAVEASFDEVTVLARNYEGLGESGEVAVLAEDSEGGAVFIVPTRSDPNAALTRRIAPTEKENPFLRAVREQATLSPHAVTDKGKVVFAATRRIDIVPWGIVVTMDRSEALGAVRQLRAITTLMSLVAAVVVIIVAVFFARVTTKPILSLTAAVKRFEEGELTIRSTVSSRDELGELSRAFNAMADRLKASYEDLEKRNLLLAEQVEAIRTKNEELERLNRLTVGRELRMAELKEENAALRKELEHLRHGQ